jgi:hypothetical protein
LELDFANPMGCVFLSHAIANKFLHPLIIQRGV